MWLILEVASEKPLYLQIRDQIVEAIAAGRLRRGVALPTIRQLASDFGVNLHTVHKAYELLRDEGFIQLNRKIGATVAVSPGTLSRQDEWRARLRTLLAEPVARELDTETIISTCRQVLDEFAVERSGQGDSTKES